MIFGFSVVLAFVVGIVVLHIYDKIYSLRGRKNGDDLVSVISPLFLLLGAAVYWLAYLQDWPWIASSLLGTIFWSVILTLLSVVDWAVFSTIFYFSYDNEEA